MRTCVRYLKIQRSREEEGNPRFANEGNLRFVSVRNFWVLMWTLESQVRE